MSQAQKKDRYEWYSDLPKYLSENFVDVSFQLLQMITEVYYCYVTNSQNIQNICVCY